MPKSKVNVRGLITGLILLIGISIFILMYDFPKTIDVMYPAMEYRLNKPESGETTKIKIKGTLTQPLFRDPIFNGVFIIDKYDSTKNYELIDIVFNKKTLNGMGALTYVNYDKGDVDLDTFGAIWIDGKFELLSIQVFEPVDVEQKTAKDLRITAPVTNYNQAMLINKNLLCFDIPK
jgi:hypothetical protein